MEFGSWLSKIMHDRGWTQQWLSEQVGVSQPTIVQWLKGRNKPETAHLTRLAALTETNVIWLFKEVGHLPESAVGPEARDYDPEIEAIIRAWRQLPVDEREALKQLITAAAKRHSGQKVD